MLESIRTSRIKSEKALLAFFSFLSIVPCIAYAKDAENANGVTVAISWKDCACNKTGSISIRVQNNTGQNIALPRIPTLGTGALFIASLKIKGEVISTVGDGYKTAYDPNGWNSSNTQILKPNATVNYDVELSKPASENVLTGSFVKSYSDFISSGGDLMITYSLPSYYSSPVKSADFYGVNLNDGEVISSNVLSCNKP